MFSSVPQAEWEYVSFGMHSNKYYFDYEKNRKIHGFIYFWLLKDFAQVDKNGDCKLFGNED